MGTQGYRGAGNSIVTGIQGYKDMVYCIKYVWRDQLNLGFFFASCAIIAYLYVAC